LTVLVAVRLFARYREATGRERLDLDLPEGSTVETAWAAVVNRHPELAQYRSFTLFAVGHEYVLPDQNLRAGDELCLFPPVSGGQAPSSIRSARAGRRGAVAVPPPRSKRGRGPVAPLHAAPRCLLQSSLPRRLDILGFISLAHLGFVSHDHASGSPFAAAPGDPAGPREVEEW
jgi:molybdopterin converting factor subunit 1